MTNRCLHQDDCAERRSCGGRRCVHVAADDTYQGHLPDGSSVQKHSAGGAYPYVLVLRDSQRPGAKFDWGLIGPGIDDPIWFKTSEGWDRGVDGLKG